MSNTSHFDGTAPGGAAAAQPATSPAGASAPAMPATGPPVVVGRRIAAALVDFVGLWILALLVGALFGGLTGGVGFELSGGPALLLFALAFAYYIVPEGILGQTPGKMALGIKVVAVDGSPASWGAIVGRNLLRVVDGFFFYLVGLIVMLSTKQKQRVGDLAAKTLVVRTGP